MKKQKRKLVICKRNEPSGILIFKKHKMEPAGADEGREI